MVLRVDSGVALGLVLRGGLLGDLEPALRARAQTPGVVLRLGVARAEEILFPPVLLLPRRDPARTHRGAWREDEEALRAECVEEVSVMAHNEAGTGKGLQRLEQGGLGRFVEVVRWLVEGEDARFAPEGGRDLRAFALAVAERLPTSDPCRIHAKPRAPGDGKRIARRKKVIEVVGGEVGALDDVARTPDGADRTRRRLKLAGGKTKKRRLTASVRADDAGPLALRKKGLDILEEIADHAVVGEGDVGEFQESGHFSGRLSR